jgi:glycerol-3-phosphate O-acyltransferase
MKTTSYILEGRFGLPLRYIFNKLFKPVNLSEDNVDTLLSIKDKGHIVFISAKSSVMDTLLLIQKCKELGLPVPKIIFGNSLMLFQPAWKFPLIIKDMITGNNPFKSGKMVEIITNA